jgi:catechol 2,3-dioxygenase-like lactoylglutathione lyase family enzyme
MIIHQRLASRVPLADNALMPLLRIEHYLVISDDLEVTKRFYCDGLGMREGPRPPFAFKGLWLYVGEVAVIHVAERESYMGHYAKTELPAVKDTGALDHIAFAAEDYDGVLARLEQHGYQVRKSGVPGGRLRQLFVRDPHGVQVELNFRNPA